MKNRDSISKHRSIVMSQDKIYEALIQSPLFQSGPIVLFLWENVAGWPVQAVSANIKRLYGYEMGSYISGDLAYADQIHPEDVQRVFSEVQEASLSEEESFIHKPYRYKAQDGNYRWVQDSTLILKDDAGNITHYVGYISDISELIATQEILKEQEGRYQELFTMAPVGIALNKMDGSFVELNAALYEMCGYTKEEFLKLSYWDITPQKYEAQEAKQLESLVKTGKYGPYAKEYLHKDGRVFPVLLNGIITKDRFGEEYIWSIIQDMTEQTKLNEEIEENKLRFKTLFNVSNDALFFLKDGLFEKCNPKFYEMIGYEEGELKEQGPVELSPEFQSDGMSSLDKASLILDDVMKGNPRIFEWKHTRKDGSILDTEISISLMDYKGEKIIAGSWRDISERNRVEKELKKLNDNLLKSKREAEIANNAKSTFLANVSHEIRTPMNAILGFVDILSKGETDQNRRTQFDHIRSSGQSLLTIINDTLDFSKIESQKLTIENHSFITKEPLENACCIYQENAQAKDITFDYHFEELPQSVFGDSVRIKQVLFNLLSNAIKFTSEKGKVVLRASFDFDKDLFICSVEDTGKGIASDNIHKIFNPFEQEDYSTTREFGGTGLGLAISSSLIEMMQGELNVTSEVGKGSTFSFCIPLEIDHEINEGQELTSDALPSTFSGHLLIVEDNKTNQALLKIYLSEMGLSFDIANDGLEGVRAFEKGHYDLILMDENMPNMNGMEATAKIHALEKEKDLKPTPIVAVTANALHGDKERFLAAGMIDYISKPFDESDLKRVFAIYL